MSWSSGKIRISHTLRTRFFARTRCDQELVRTKISIFRLSIRELRSRIRDPVPCSLHGPHLEPSTVPISVTEKHCIFPQFDSWKIRSLCMLSVSIAQFSSVCGRMWRSLVKWNLYHALLDTQILVPSFQTPVPDYRQQCSSIHPKQFGTFFSLRWKVQRLTSKHRVFKKRGQSNVTTSRSEL